jgi:hypothetical protein
MDVSKYVPLTGSKFDQTARILMHSAPDKLKAFIDNIQTSKNFNCVKFGDGEWLNMTATNENERNCDGGRYFRALGDDLIRAYIWCLQNENTFVSRWHSQIYAIENALDFDFCKDTSKFVYYDIFTHKLPFMPEQVAFFKAIQSSPRKKIYVSNTHMINKVVPLLNMNIGVCVPQIDCYLHKDTIIQHILSQVDKDCIVLFSCGMASKVLLTDVAKQKPDNTFIDIGSTFDGLVRVSRDYNASPLYRNILLRTYQ